MLKPVLIVLYIICSAVYLQAQTPTGEYHIRKVVIDAGHGGNDPGVVGRTLKEKDFVLAVALKTGKLLKEKYPDLQVIYTRDKDVFVELHERGNIANRNNADLFISLHANSVANRKNTSVGGFETYVMGTSKVAANMSVAMKENAVVEYEKDYTTKYQGYDPKNPESFIIFSLLQNAYLEQSLMMASLVQDELADGTPIKTNRGVKQAPFLVLWKTAMPSILIELAFISNPAEEELMKKETTRDAFAKSITAAFTKYKNHYERQPKTNIAATAAEEKKQPAAAPETKAETKPEAKEEKMQTAPTASDPRLFPSQQTTPAAADAPEKNAGKTTASNDDAIIYCVQLFNSNTKERKNSAEFQNLKGLPDVRCTPVGKLYKYTTGSYSTPGEAQKVCNGLQKKYPGAFVVGLQNGTIIQVKR